jgi:DNA-binding NarL/FixJ family response regulator
VKTILIIEDEPGLRSNFATILRMEGYRPLTAPDGPTGLDLARSDLPDLILCDVIMPGMDGYEVLRVLRQEKATAAIPFIFLTGKGTQAEVRAGMNLGADDYLAKPASVSDLLGAISARLEREQVRPPAAFQPDFSSPAPLEALGLTTREAEVLLWVAQGKSNGEIATILGTTDNTVKKHLQNTFEKLGVDSRNAATFRALQVLSSPKPAP